MNSASGLLCEQDERAWVNLKFFLCTVYRTKGPPKTLPLNTACWVNPLVSYVYRTKGPPKTLPLNTACWVNPLVSYVYRTKGPPKTLTLNTACWVNLKSLMYTGRKGPRRLCPWKNTVGWVNLKSFMYTDERAPEDSAPEHVGWVNLKSLMYTGRKGPRRLCPWTQWVGSTSNLLCNRTKGPPKTLPLNTVGWVNYLTVDWISGTMWKALRVSVFFASFFCLHTVLN
jgi:hypothetical protein